MSRTSGGPHEFTRAVASRLDPGGSFTGGRLRLQLLGAGRPSHFRDATKRAAFPYAEIQVFFPLVVGRGVARHQREGNGRPLVAFTIARIVRNSYAHDPTVGTW